MPVALGDGGFEAERGVEVSSILPELAGCFAVAGVLIQKRKGANGIGEIEEFRVEIAAIYFEGFVVERPGFGVPGLNEIHIRDVADGVGVGEAIVLAVVDLRGLGVVCAGFVQAACRARQLALGDGLHGSGHTGEGYYERTREQ